MITKKFKDFSDLHHNLMSEFAGLRFPDSAYTLFNPMNQDVGNNMKKPGFMDERRKNLQWYIRDISRIEIIRNSKFFKHFLSNEGLFNDFIEDNNDDINSIIIKIYYKKK